MAMKTSILLRWYHLSKFLIRAELSSLTDPLSTEVLERLGSVNADFWLPFVEPSSNLPLSGAIVILNPVLPLIGVLVLSLLISLWLSYRYHYHPHYDHHDHSIITGETFR